MVAEVDADILDGVQVQRNGVTRVRPAMQAGWAIDVRILVLLPEYISEELLHDVLVNAGRLVGIGGSRFGWAWRGVAWRG